MLTSFAPSPIANVIADLICCLTNFTTSAFYAGDDLYTNKADVKLIIDKKTLLNSLEPNIEGSLLPAIIIPNSSDVFIIFPYKSSSCCDML
jgi:hypothetical protein